MVKITASGFGWDSGNRSKCQTHGLTPSEIEEFFTRGIYITPDFKHSQKEERYLAGRLDTKWTTDVCGVYVAGKCRESVNPSHQCAVYARKRGEKI